MRPENHIRPTPRRSDGGQAEPLVRLKHEFSDLLVEDFKIRKFIKGKYSHAGIPKIEIETHA